MGRNVLQIVVLVVGSVVTLFGISGCGTTGGTGMMSPASPFDFVYGKTDAELSTYFSALGQSLKDDEQEYYAAGTTQDRQRQLRDKIINYLRTPTEDFWRRYQSAIWGETAATHSVLSVGATTLNAGGSCDVTS